MLLGTLGSSLLQNLLIVKGITKANDGVVQADKRDITAEFLILPRLLTNFKKQKQYQNEPGFNGAYSRNNLPKIKDRAYVGVLNEYKSIGTHSITLYVNSDNRRASYNEKYFDCFELEHIPKEI